MLISQAKEWESSGEHARAVDCYLKVTKPHSSIKKDAEPLSKLRRCFGGINRFFQTTTRLRGKFKLVYDTCGTNPNDRTASLQWISPTRDVESNAGGLGVHQQKHHQPSGLGDRRLGFKAEV